VRTHAGAQSLGLHRHQRVGAGSSSTWPTSAGSSSTCAADRSWIGLISPASGCPVTERTQLERDTERSGAGGPLSAKASLRGSDTRERPKDFRSVPNTVMTRVAAGPDEQHERRLLAGRRFERRADADELFGASTRTPAFAPRSESGRAERATCSAWKAGAPRARFRECERACAWHARSGRRARALGREG
jgi:hypothetical protein